MKNYKRKTPINMWTHCPMCQGQAYIEVDVKHSWQYMLTCVNCGYRNYLKLANQTYRQRKEDMCQEKKWLTPSSKH